MCLGFAQIAGLPQAKGPNALRERSFDPGSQTIALFEGWRRLTLACSLNGLMLGVWTKRQLTRVARRGGAQLAARTGQAISLAELDPNDLGRAAVVGRLPLAAGLTLGAGHLPGLPVNRELGRVILLPSFGFPTRVNRHWPHQIDAMLKLEASLLVPIDVAGISEMFTGQ